jgi:hypothetical protein
VKEVINGGKLRVATVSLSLPWSTTKCRLLPQDSHFYSGGKKMLQEISVRTVKGSVKTKASTFDGFLGVHPAVTNTRFAGGWSVTHIPSGVVAMTLPNTAEANYMLKRLSEMPMDWSQESLDDTFTREDWLWIMALAEEFYAEMNKGIPNSF